MNEKLILRALRSIIERQNQSYNNNYPEIYFDLERAINPKEKQSLLSKTADALRGKSK